MSSLVEKIGQTYEEEGPYWIAVKGKNVVKAKLDGSIGEVMRGHHLSAKEKANRFYDIVFINGCDYSVPHPIRYRVDHQMEQLTAAGFSCLKIEASEISEDYLRMARMFIIFRCPHTDQIEEFILKAQKLNKRVFYDIDDLVIDTVYTDLIPYVKQMSDPDRELYDNGVLRMGRTLTLCDGAITSTEDLAQELKKYVPVVFVNRNNASDGMLRISEEAIYRRDILPYLADNQVKKRYRKIQRRWKNRAKSQEVILGYFSGSITHNADFDLVVPSIVRLFREYPNLRLMVVGDLTIPDALLEFQERLIVQPFGSWRQLPFYIAQCDINLAPLEDTIFNRAKSENKWVEASLVKVPTVASNVGAFKHSIKNAQTGILANDDEWYEELKSLIDDPTERRRIGKNAYAFCKQHRVTVYNTENIKNIIDSIVMPNIGFVLPSTNISGGVLVTLKHASILQNAGYDVTLIPLDSDDKWLEFETAHLPVLDRLASYGEIEECVFYGHFDKLVATLWDTLDFALRYDKVGRIYYFVQNFEVDFYLPGSPLRIEASKTYQAVPNVTYITISKWCENWLEEKYGIKPRFAPNGLDVDRFYAEKRDYRSNKIRVLIEGDCGSEYKNVDEAFEITNQLDPNKFEIWYMCYTGKTKSFYRIDNNLGCVPQEKVADVYRECHILLKTSKLESFSYPPLEMMATGGIVVVRPNGGNAEYVKDKYNCIFYDPDDLDGAVQIIENLVQDEDTIQRLFEGGVSTAKARDWKAIEKEILELYE